MDRNFVFVIKQKRNVPYGTSDAYIYSNQGNLLKSIDVPPLIPDLAKNMKIIEKRFRQVSWEKIDSILHIVFSIQFNLEWYEERILNIETGQFGECIGSGRI